MEPQFQAARGGGAAKGGPARLEALVNRMRVKAATLPSAQTAALNYILGSVEEVAFLPIAETARLAEVSQATLVRLARACGFRGYHELRRELVAAFKDRVSPSQRLVSGLANLDGASSVLRRIAETEVSCLASTVKANDEDTFSRCIEALARASRVVLYGEGPAVGLTRLLEYRLRRFRYDVLAVNESGKELFEKVVDLRRGDVVLAFAFLRPSWEVDIVLGRAREVGATAILVTDLPLSILAGKADLVLRADRGPTGVFKSMVAPLVVAEAIVLGVAKAREGEVLEALRDLESLRQSYGYPRLSGVHDPGTSSRRRRTGGR